MINHCCFGIVVLVLIVFMYKVCNRSSVSLDTPVRYGKISDYKDITYDINTCVSFVGKNRMYHCETVSFNNTSGDMYGFCEDGWIRKLDKPYTGTPINYIHVGPVPIAGKIVGDKIVFLDAIKGVAVTNLDRTFRILSNMVDDAHTRGDIESIGFADDLDIATDGKIYFSDAAPHLPPMYGADIKVNLVHDAGGNFLDGKHKGRVLVYDPLTKKTTTLFSGLWFANGVALSKDQNKLYVAELYRNQLWEYDLKTKEASVVIKSFPGHLDSISLGIEDEDVLWVSTPVITSPLHETIANSRLLRIIFTFIPFSLLPKNNFNALIKVNIKNKNIIGIYLSNSKKKSKERNVLCQTSPTEYEGKVYLGNLCMKNIPVVDTKKCKKYKFNENVEKHQAEN
eukprot:GHVR01020338.1.p1 GENE.GHVR01020338.1~~GHVR01020338.1.p1  ORF type:complete len:396 (+),score=86.53 GHVR01020338.1:63-1250(+)